MANNPAMNPTAALGDATRVGEIRSRVLFLIGALIVYRIGTFIPVPGIDPERVAAFFSDQSGTILGVVNMFSGGAMERMSIFAMGVMPYISASIIIQMMSMVVPSLMELRKEGESGRRKITQLTRYGTVILGVFQSFAAAVTLQSNGMVLTPGFFAWLFPATIASFLGSNPNSAASGVLQRVAASLSYGQPLHMMLYAALIIGFAFFYTALVFNSRDTAENLQKSGAFIPGIRPGKQTGEYIDKVLTRLTLWGGLYMTGVCLVPELLMANQGVPFQFGGTSLLIVVVVVMDFIAQLQAHAMSHQYPGLMKKANLLGGRNSGGDSRPR